MRRQACVGQSLGQVFCECADPFRNRVALEEGTATLTFGELQEDSGRIARGLGALGISSGDRVGLNVSRGVAAVSAMLGIIRAGACYVPLDPAYPTDRLDFMVEDAALPLVIVDGSDRGSFSTATVHLHELLANGQGRVCEEPANDRSDPAYVIYTSGSTGVPKGVVVTHGNVLSLLEAALPLFDIGPEDRWSHFASYSFDVSVWEMWGALLTGATGVVVPAGIAGSPADFVGLLADHRVTVLNQVPSVFSRVVDAYTRLDRPELALRYVIFAGEALQRVPVKRFTDQVRGGVPTFVNMYGITETTVHASIKTVSDHDLTGSGPTPIGRPLPHLDFRVVSETGIPAPDGGIGELWVAGAGVAMGYLNRPRLTEERFVTADLDGSDRLFYCSGDLVSRDAVGEYEYHGRADDQVKIRGVRVELGEVEHLLCAHPQIRAAAAATTSGPRGDLLVALVVPATPDSAPSVRELRTFVADRALAALVPNRIAIARELPLSPSGKVDRRAVCGLVEAERRSLSSAS